MRISNQGDRSSRWWLDQAWPQFASILEDTYRWDFRLRRLGSALERVRQGFAPECRLSGIDLQICVPDWNVSAEVDEQGLVAGLTGAIVATLGLVGQIEAAAITLIVNASAGESPSIDIAEDMVAVPAAAASRFFDPTWSDRPGGWAATIGAVAAKKVAEEHGGHAALVARDGRSSVIRLNLGRVR